MYYVHLPLCFATNVCCSTIIAVSLYPIINRMHHHLSWRLVCIIAGLFGQSPLGETMSANKGQIFWGAFSNQNLLHKTKSFDKGQILETHNGQSPLCKTKSSEEGQILEANCGQSLLCKTKSSTERQISLTFQLKYALIDKVLQWGAGSKDY